MIKLAENSQVNTDTPTTSASYYLRSSVTGNVIREYDYSGALVKSNVFIGNQMIAQQSVSTGNTQMLWQHKNPVTGDCVSTDSTGHSMSVTRMDATGVAIGDSDPFSTPQAGFGEVAGQDTSQPLMGSMVAGLFPTGGSAGCTVDGMLTGCALVNTILSAGAGVQCPENDCGPRRATYTDPIGRQHDFITNPFSASEEGSGFGISGATRDTIAQIRHDTLSPLDHEYAFYSENQGQACDIAISDLDPCNCLQPPGDCGTATRRSASANAWELVLRF